MPSEAYLESVKARVTKGATFLDEERPGWYRDIDLSNLDMNDPMNCVLGQLEGEFTRGTDVLFEVNGGSKTEQAINHGFDGSLVPHTGESRHDEYKWLDDFWFSEIYARRHPGKNFLRRLKVLIIPGYNE
jgi:hypothetical protein